MNRRFLTITLALALLMTIAFAATEPTTMASPVDSSIYTGYSNSKYECTWYAWGRFKQIWGESLPVWGNAGNWLTNAANAGWPTGQTPQKGAIACWEATVWDTTNHVNGHVAVVEWVDSTASTIRISQYNRGVSKGGYHKFGGMDGNTWTENFLEKISTTSTSWNGNRPPKPSGYIYPKETKKNVTVIFNPNDGITSPTQKTYTYTSDEKFENIPIPSRVGYNFFGWYENLSNLGTELSATRQIKWFSDGTSNVTLTVYPWWVPMSYTLTFDATGGTATRTKQTITYDDSYGDIPVPTRNGYTFDGWYTSAEGGSRVTSDTTVKTASDHTLYARWTKISCDGNHGGSEFLYTDTGHPHKSYYRCSVCGEQFDDGSESYLESCVVCNPPEPEQPSASAEPIETPSSKPIVTPSAPPSSKPSVTPSATPSTKPVATPSATPSTRPDTSSVGGQEIAPPTTPPVERDFTDWDQVQHQNAVAGCNDLGIINGKPDGSFDPGGNIDRASWAKMVYYAATGNPDADVYLAIPVGLDDIQGNWAESYITYLALNNIVAGDGTGNFRPSRNVTVVEACKIMLTILGYDADERGYQNNAAWAENIMTDAYAVGLMKNVDPDQSATASLTRDNAAEIIYNALRATTQIYRSGSYTAGGALVFEVFGVRPDQLP